MAATVAVSKLYLTDDPVTSATVAVSRLYVTADSNLSVAVSQMFVTSDIDPTRQVIVKTPIGHRLARVRTRKPGGTWD